MSFSIWAEQTSGADGKRTDRYAGGAGASGEKIFAKIRSLGARVERGEIQKGSYKARNSRAIALYVISCQWEHMGFFGCCGAEGTRIKENKGIRMPCTGSVIKDVQKKTRQRGRSAAGRPAEKIVFKACKARTRSVSKNYGC